MRELTREYICNNSPKFSERLDAGCYNNTLSIILCIILLLLIIYAIHHFLLKIIDLLQQR